MSSIDTRSVVSILVFVELAPGLHILLSGDPGVAFQSLFLWNSRPDLIKVIYLLLFYWFQSLFLWNSRPDLEQISPGREDLVVSILVFVELAPGLYRDHGVRPRDHVSILVFVELAPGLDRGALLPPRPILFQSLFLWNSRPDRMAASGLIQPFSVSILVFVELAPGLGRESPGAGTDSVSILVFVELAPGLSGSHGYSAELPRFNPCFCGTRARTSDEKETLHEALEVSILVFVELAPGHSG